MRRMNDKNLISGMLAIVAVIVLIIPAVTSYTAELHKKTIVLSADSDDFSISGYLNSDVVNFEQFDSVFWQYSNVFAEPDNDTVYIASQSGYYQKAFADEVITVDNINTVSANFELVDYALKDMYFGLDTTSKNISDADFIVINYAGNHQLNGIYFYDDYNSFIGLSYPIQKSETQWYIILDVNAKNTIEFYPDAQLLFKINDIDDLEPIFDFEIYYCQLSPSVWAWDDFQLYSISIMASIFVTWVAIIFSTDIIDIKIDKSRKK